MLPAAFPSNAAGMSFQLTCLAAVRVSLVDVHVCVCLKDSTAEVLFSSVGGRAALRILEYDPPQEGIGGL